MKRGTTVLFVLDHKLRDGILVRQTPTEAIIRTTEKVYKVRKTQVATEDIGGRNARARFSVCRNNASDSGRNGEKGQRVRPSTGGETESPPIFKGGWPV